MPEFRVSEISGAQKHMYPDPILAGAPARFPYAGAIARHDKVGTVFPAHLAQSSAKLPARAASAELTIAHGLFVSSSR
jgi:hypothetical protein